MRLRFGFALFATLLLAPLSALAGQAAAPSAAPAAPLARPTLIEASAFTERSGLSELTLSPDGSKIALRTVPKDGKVTIGVLDAVTRKGEHNLAVPEKNELDWFRWAGNRRLLVALSAQSTFYGEEVRITRLFVYDLDKRSFTFIGKEDMGLDGDDVIHVDPDGQFVLLSMQRTIMDWPSVWRFPLDETARKAGKKIQPERRDVWNWFADNKGVVRMGIEYLDSGRLRVLYRKDEIAAFRPIATFDSEKDDKKVLWQMLRIVTESDDGLILDDDGSGNVVLRKFNYSTGMAGDTVYAQPGWDIDEVWIDEDNKPVAAFYTDDRDKVVWFNPVMKTLQGKLDRALKDN